MSDFFGPPPPPPPAPPDHRSPEWSGPPENELGVVVPVQLELIRSDALSLAIRALIVYSTGSLLMLALRRRKRPPLPAAGPLPFHAFSQPDSLRFGVQFADGSKATAGRPMRPGDEISPPALVLRGTRNGGRSAETEMWMWPLPPPGPLEFVCEWRAEGIELTRRQLDAQLILDAAAQVEELWPDERPVTPAWTGLG